MDVDIKATKKRFLAINRERLRRTQNSLRWKQRHFLELLPIFFHLNHALLPGYISKNTPAGIPFFNPSKKGLDAIKKMAKSFTHKKRALRQYEIQSIFIMGSVGTIAHSEKSDFDIWICHGQNINATRMGELRAKCVAIEKWAEAIGLEVHFFTMDADEFRKGEVHELSSESSGSTQHHLLLEEFYRTSLLVAGRFPIWWIVPPQHEKNYDEYVYELLHKRFISDKEVIDFGGLAEIPAEEFFGAALWQVYKGIDSPYKSVLKILLMEIYASVYPNIEMLSLQYKRMIYDGVIDLNELDPYNILLKKLEDYLAERGEVERIDLVRRCFYFKVNIPLSQKNTSTDNWRYEVMWEKVQSWGWDEYKLAILDKRDKWKIDVVLKERKILVDELTQSYLFLSNFARNNTNLARISQKDLNVLGRKLYAAFERKPGKIELVNRGVSTNVFENKLTFQQTINQDGEENWSLLNEQETDKGLKNKLLKRGRGVTELFVWCHFNRLISRGTVISLDLKNSILSVKEVKSILDALDGKFPNGKIPPVDIEYFGQQPAIMGGCVFTDVGLDPLPAHTRRGTDIVSDKTDILNYSGFSFNLALTFDLVVVTSWQEILTYRYSGIDGLLNCMCQYLRWHLNGKSPLDFKLSAFSFSSTHCAAIAQRIEQLFDDALQIFYKKGKLEKLRYIVEVEESFYILYIEGENFKFERAKSTSALFETLSLPKSNYLPIKVDRNALSKTLLPVIAPKCKQGKIQFFYEKDGGFANIYVLDENGSLFYQRLPFHDDHALLNQYILFINSVFMRQNLFGSDSEEATTVEDVIFCRVVKLSKKYTFKRKIISSSELRKRYFHVQVVGHIVEKKTEFTIYCDGREFSSMDYGGNLFHEVAKHVISLRQSGARYPIYITDLDLAPIVSDEGTETKVQLIEHLNYKKRIEEKLNAEINKL